MTNAILTGLMLGGMYALIAMGLTLQYGVARIMNLSYGEFLIAAAFASPEGKAVADDTPNFLDMSRFELLVTEEKEIPLPTSGAG